MIYSGVNDNWQRVAVMHRIAKDHYLKTAGTEFRARFIGRGEFFPHDVNAADCIVPESAIVGLIVAWSVIMLESIVNHRLADVIEDKAEATKSIEYPSTVLGKKQGSELAMKIIILSGNKRDDDLLRTAQSLSGKRNRVVHDKPFELTDLGDNGVDGVDVHHFISRTSGEMPPKWFEQLGEFYADCEKVFEFVQRISAERIVCEVNFSSLIPDCGQAK